MKRGRITLAVVAAIAASVLGLTLSSASSASAKPRAGARPVVINCLGKPQAEPSSIVLACADGNSALSGLSWTSWTPKLGSASGTLMENDCIPYCAAGHFHRYPALVVLWGTAPYQHGQRYTEITVIFPAARPLVYNGHDWVEVPQSYSSPLWTAPTQPAARTKPAQPI
jgi:hypothetical protein